MRRKSRKNSKDGAGKLITGFLVGGVIGATVGWLTAPAAGAETRRRLSGEVMSARDKAKTATGNVESRARELAEEVNDHVENLRKTSTTHRKRSAAVRN
ncbi:MAG TPA: YtxH domain-containing protein [Anaerolineales bacterium]|nr:YtxH domain-containing protein [Anaerolineales bacterium]